MSQMTQDGFDALRTAVLVRTPTAIMHLIDAADIRPGVLHELADRDLAVPFSNGHYKLTMKGYSLRCRLMLI